MVVFVPKLVVEILLCHGSKMEAASFALSVKGLAPIVPPELFYAFKHLNRTLKAINPSVVVVHHGREDYEFPERGDTVKSREVRQLVSNMSEGKTDSLEMYLDDYGDAVQVLFSFVRDDQRKLVDVVCVHSETQMVDCDLDGSGSCHGSVLTHTVKHPKKVVVNTWSYLDQSTITLNVVKMCKLLKLIAK